MYLYLQWKECLSKDFSFKETDVQENHRQIVKLSPSNVGL